MKRWAAITVLLYLATLVILTEPLYLTCFGLPYTNSLNDMLAFMRHWGYWLWIGVSAAGQILLLAVPVALGERRPRSRRHLLVPVITAAFLFALVCVSAISALAAGIWGDKCDFIFGIFGDSDNRALLAVALYIGVAWTVWAVVFHQFLNSAYPETLIPRLLRWLLRGSILELLVAVPSHVITRQRHDCCAPAVTFWGIATGLTVMLLSFGPGVFFLFVKRVRRLQSRTSKDK